MKHGIAAFVTDASTSPVVLAKEVEDRGFESLWLPEHSHLPRAGGADSPEVYAHLYDQFIALAAAATVTTRLNLATGVSLIAQRDPIYTAKQVASLDHLSRGRVLLGVGAGSNRTEMVHHGVDPVTRMARLAEHVKAMKALWDDTPAGFTGKFTGFAESISYPKPARKPHPPVLVGGMGPGVEDRVLDFGDAWLPIRVPRQEAGRFKVRVAALQRKAAECGRAPIPVTLMEAESGPAAIEAYRDAGIERVVHLIRDTHQSALLKRLDALAAATEGGASDDA
ncbi:LLM class F420-dependent oxidoreductase [Amycolatopsis endophytica]|uniref:Putative F420-dependent oxidoreductase n=1 Tax=Amycolatopsis endophytica TaxID=860233 RepID=A0A853B202_9PSEU|nr:TIGR03619 family F420-dependent LLM class oxidoreductase [Amycolatopsis endophytica]NYI88847.1 putative F420-dependent oxidoreductase [Amycolatopsis endophytica]